MSRLYWGRAASPWGSLRLLSTEHGLCLVVLPGTAGVERWVGRHLADSEPVEGGPLLDEAIRQLQQYFAGVRRSFDLDLRGTDFQQRVWRALLGIPYGQRRSYRQIAVEIGHPQAIRAVGTANGANPLPIIVPCHRVVRSDGSLGGYGGGLAMKQALLRLEEGDG
jgi:O-6-methylguanine DNA methyltransferase